MHRIIKLTQNILKNFFRSDKQSALNLKQTTADAQNYALILKN